MLRVDHSKACRHTREMAEHLSCYETAIGKRDGVCNYGWTLKAIGGRGAARKRGIKKMKKKRFQVKTIFILIFSKYYLPPYVRERAESNVVYSLENHSSFILLCSRCILYLRKVGSVVLVNAEVISWWELRTHIF